MTTFDLMNSPSYYVKEGKVNREVAEKIKGTDFTRPRQVQNQQQTGRKSNTLLPNHHAPRRQSAIISLKVDQTTDAIQMTKLVVNAYKRGSLMPNSRLLEGIEEEEVNDSNNDQVRNLVLTEYRLSLRCRHQARVKRLRAILNKGLLSTCFSTTQ